MNTECVDIIKGQCKAIQLESRNKFVFLQRERDRVGVGGGREREREERRKREQKGWLETVERGLLEEIPMC